MFDLVEKYHNFFKILLALIALSFITFGVNAFTASGHDYISQIGDEKVSEHDIRRIMQSNQMPITEETRQKIYQSLLQQAYLIEGGKEIGITVSDEQVKNIIIKEPSFSENGAFSQEKYAQFLRNTQMSEADFVNTLRKEYITQNVLHLLSSSVMVSDAQAEQLLKVYDSIREVQEVSFATQSFIDKVNASKENIQAYYDAHQQHYTQPLAIKYSYVKADTQILMPQQTVSDDELKTRLAAANAQKIETDEETLKKQIQQEKATRALSVVKETMADVAFNQAKDIDAVAKAVKLPVERQTQWLTEQEMHQSHLPSAVVSALLSDEVLHNGNNSDAFDADGGVWVVRVDAVREQKVLPLAEVEEKVRHDYIQQEARTLAIQAANEAFQSLTQAKDKQTTMAWDSTHDLSLGTAKESLSHEDFLRLIQATPQADKPAYVLLKDTPEPTILKVNNIKLPESMAEKLPLAKLTLVQRNGADDLAAYLKYLERTIKYKAGMQKLNTESSEG